MREYYMSKINKIVRLFKVLIAVVFILTVALFITIVNKNDEIVELEEVLEEVIEEKIQKEETVEVYFREIVRSRKEVMELEEALDELEEEINALRGILGKPAIEVELTFYAPLDPNAVEGMCYSGDPRVTRSGEPSQPGVSIAAPPHIPLGTEVFIEGFGHRVVHDRGGAVKGNIIDVMVWSREEALRLGRVERKMWILR